jgi:hypothetical protein
MTENQWKVSFKLELSFYGWVNPKLGYVVSYIHLSLYVSDMIWLITKLANTKIYSEKYNKTLQSNEFGVNEHRWSISSAAVHVICYQQPLTLVINMWLRNDSEKSCAQVACSNWDREYGLKNVNDGQQENVRRPLFADHRVGCCAVHGGYGRTTVSCRRRSC